MIEMGKNKKNGEPAGPSSQEPVPNDDDIYSLAVQKWGQDVQLDILLEELAEAIEAVVDFKDPGTVDRFVKGATRAGKMIRRPGGVGGIDGLFGAIGLTVAQYIKMQARQLKSTLKMIRKKGLSVYNEQFDMRTMMESAFLNMNTLDEDQDEVDPKEHLAEELADVELMIEQARHGMGLSDLIDKHKRLKVERLRKRIEGEDVEANA